MFQRMLKRHTTEGVRLALRRLVEEMRMLRGHRRGLRRARSYASQSGLRLHLGCGSKLKTGWVNVDLSPQADVSLDLREPLPFAAGCCSLIYTEHFLEHLDYPEPAHGFLRECLRVLEPGGTLSVGVPDTGWPLEEMAGHRNEGYFRLAKERWHPPWCETPLEHLNHHFREYGNHRFAYDEETLGAALRRAGFAEIRRRPYDPERDSADRQPGTLYVDARKPF